MTRLACGLMLAAALCVLNIQSTEAAQRERGQRQAPRSEPRSSTPVRTAAPRGEAARPAPDSGRGTSSTAGRERGVDNAGRARVPSRDGDARAERGETARARAARPVAVTPETATTSNTDEARGDDGGRTNTVVPRWPTERAGEVRAEAAATRSDDDQRRAVPRGSRDRGGNPRTGTVVPRSGDGWRGDGYRRGGRNFYGSRTRTFNNYYYYYPRRYHPYGFGAFGLGYFYYDPYTWYRHDPYWHGGYPYYGYGYYGSGGYGYGGYGHRGGYGYEFGELRLQVEPRHAEVYVDGYFAGHVDDFDGVFQSLTLEDGGHKIEIVAPGFEPLVVDIRILPSRKVTYRGALKPAP